MTQSIGSPKLSLVPDAPDVVAKAEADRKSIAAALEHLVACRRELLNIDDRQTIGILDVALLQLSLRAAAVGDAELRALCDTLSLQSILPAGHGGARGGASA